MLIRYIQSKYNNAIIELKDKKLNITSKTESITDHYRPLVDVLKEIAKYSRNVSIVDSVKMDIENVASNPENKVVNIRHDISMSYRDWQVTKTRADGSKEYSKTQPISF